MAKAQNHLELKIPFPVADEKNLQKILGPQIDAKKVARLIAEIGALEVLDQAFGKSEPRTLAEQRQYRLKWLLLSGIPLEQAEIVTSAIFKIPPTSSRRLIETTAARFDVELWSEKVNSARAALERAWFDGGKVQAWEVAAPSALVRKWLKEEANRGDQPPPRPSGRGSVWLLKNDTYRYLCGVVDLKPRDPDAED